MLLTVLRRCRRRRLLQLADSVSCIMHHTIDHDYRGSEALFDSCTNEECELHDLAGDINCHFQLNLLSTW